MTMLIMAFWSIWQRRGRALLAAISLGLGIASVVLGLSIVSGYQKEIEKMTFGAYARALVIQENLRVFDPYGQPTLADGLELKSGLSGVESLIYKRTARIQVRLQHDIYFAQAAGLKGEYTQEIGERLLWGRLFTTPKNGATKRECLLGFRLAAKLKALKNPKTNMTLMVNSSPCKLVGVLAEPENRIEEAYAFSVLMPLDFLVRYVDDDPKKSIAEVDRILVIFKPGEPMRDKARKADNIMRKTHGIPQSHASGFTYRDENYPLKMLEKQRNLVAAIILVLGGLSVLVSVLGFGVIWVNMITARRREIATQFVVGARFGNIVRQLITEVIIVALVGTAAGMGVSLLASAKLQDWIKIPIDINPELLAGIAGIAVLVSVLIVLQSIIAIARTPLSLLVK